MGQNTGDQKSKWLKRGKPRAFPSRPSVSGRIDRVDVDDGRSGKKGASVLRTCRIARDEKVKERDDAAKNERSVYTMSLGRRRFGTGEHTSANNIIRRNVG